MGYISVSAMVSGLSSSIIFKSPHCFALVKLSQLVYKTFNLFKS